jgi:hypothetical protein
MMDKGNNIFEEITGEQLDAGTIKLLSKLILPSRSKPVLEQQLSREDSAIHIGAGVAVDVKVDQEMVDGDAHARARFHLPFKFLKSLIPTMLERLRGTKPK